MTGHFPQVPVFPLILMLVFLPGCSVREDRDSCPARLLVHLPPQPDPVLLWLDSAEGLQTHVLPPGTEDWTGSVPRGTVQIGAAVPAEDFDARGGLRIPEGEECPQVGLYGRRLAVSGESACDSLTFHKPFCALEIRLTETGLPYDVMVRGGVCGLDADGIPLPGTFLRRLHPDGTGTCRLRLPRQRDDSLMLDLVADGAPVRTFALGEYLAEAGYDWEAEDLADAAVTIDFARTLLTFSLAGYTRIFPIEVII